MGADRGGNMNWLRKKILSLVLGVDDKQAKAILDLVKGYRPSNSSNSVPIGSPTSWSWQSQVPLDHIPDTLSGKSADMVDGKHAGDFVLKTGDTMTGKLTIQKSGTSLDLKGVSGSSGGAANPQLLFSEEGQSSYWALIKRGSAYSGGADRILLSYYDGSNWHEAWYIEPTGNFVLDRLAVCSSGIKIGNYVLDTLVANNKVPDADKVDGKHASELGKLFNIYGDGSDGAITDSSDVTRSGILYCTTYTLNAGVTVTVDGPCLAIFATDSITIAGTITADGQGGAGGNGGSGGYDSIGNPGSSGEQGYFVAGGAGGNGGTGGYSGGAGGPAVSPVYGDCALRFFPNSAIDKIIFQEAKAGSGGSGGGGGGGHYEGVWGGSGGDGGAGGGMVVLCAPTINITGTITARGLPGEDGGSGGYAGGGGGGGGGGGVILIVTSDLSDTGATYDVSGGAGGAGGSPNGQPGSDGPSGYVIKLIL